MFARGGFAQGREGGRHDMQQDNVFANQSDTSSILKETTGLTRFAVTDGGTDNLHAQLELMQLGISFPRI